MYAELKQKVCKTCKKVKNVTEYATFKKGAKHYARSFCKECASHNWFVQDLWKHYRLRYEDYLKIYKGQEGKCACCGANEADFKRKLHVDHDHSTGQVRALLCTRCNPLIGMAKECTNKLEMAITYLKKFKK